MLVASVTSDTLCDLINCSPPAPQSMGFSRQEYWSGLLYPPPEGLPSPEIKPVPPAQGSFPTEPPGKPPDVFVCTTPYAGRNIKNFRYAYDTTLLAESKEEEPFDEGEEE